MDDAESANEYANVAGVNPASYMDAYHRDLDWAASGCDVPNHFVLTVLYEVRPFTGNRYLDAILAHWRVGGVETVMSGPAFTVLTAANTTNAFPNDGEEHQPSRGQKDRRPRGGVQPAESHQLQPARLHAGRRGLRRDLERSPCAHDSARRALWFLT